MESTTITSKGQATIPKELRDELNLKPGDRVKWFLDVHGRIVVLPERPITDLRGILSGYEALTLAEPEQIAAEEASTRDERSRHQP